MHNEMNKFSYLTMIKIVASHLLIDENLILCCPEDSFFFFFGQYLLLFVYHYFLTISSWSEILKSFLG